MNSTERLQQIFNNKPVKQKPRNIIYSNEMVKDLTDIIKYPINDIRFHLKMSSIEDKMNLIENSIENLYKQRSNTILATESLSMYSDEMSKWYQQSQEDGNFFKKVVDAIIKGAMTVLNYFIGLGKKFMTFCNRIFAKRFIITYNRAKKAGIGAQTKVEMPKHEPIKLDSSLSYKTITETKNNMQNSCKAIVEAVNKSSSDPSALKSAQDALNTLAEGIELSMGGS